MNKNVSKSSLESSVTLDFKSSFKCLVNFSLRNEKYPDFFKENET